MVFERNTELLSKDLGNAKKPTNFFLFKLVFEIYGCRWEIIWNKCKSGHEDFKFLGSSWWVYLLEYSFPFPKVPVWLGTILYLEYSPDKSNALS